MKTWEIYRDEYVVLLSHRLDLSQTKLTWKKLATYPLILSGIESCSATIRKYLQGLEASVNIAYEMREDSTITSMAMQGLDAAIMPRLVAQPIPPELKVYSLPIPLKRVIKATIVKNVLHSPAVFAFLDTLRKQ